MLKLIISTFAPISIIYFTKNCIFSINVRFYTLVYTQLNNLITCENTFILKIKKIISKTIIVNVSFF